MTIDLLAGLNPEQVQVVEYAGGPCAVYALAGSGKTESLSRLVARLVRSGTSPNRILAVTFSKKGADEMNKRIEKKFGVSGARIGTWHSLCLQILKEDRTPWADWQVEGDKGSKGDKVGTRANAKMILKDVLGWKGMDWKAADVAKLTRFIAVCKANLFEPDSDGARELAAKEFTFSSGRALEAFQRYNDALAERELLTFDDFLVFAARHLSDEENRVRWASRWDFVMQDEAQDANLAQCTIASLLARDHRNYMVIGDVFQAIYGFRGSKPEYLARFVAEWQGRAIKLPRNYRSGRSIIQAANAIVSSARVEGVEEPGGMIGERDVDGAVRILCTESLDDEANEVVTRIVQSIDSGESSLADHTILFRTNAQSRALEEALLERRVPYVVVGGVSFYERKEVRDLLAYLRLANATGRVEDIQRCINAPFRFLGKAFVERVMDEVHGRDLTGIDWPSIVEDVADGERIQSRQRASAGEWAGLVRALNYSIREGAREGAGEVEKNEAKPNVLLERIIRETRYIDWLNREEGSETTEDSGSANVREMVRVAERFQTVGELLDYIEETIRAARTQREDKQAGGERVLLMSIHRSKGLEWPHVYVVGMNEMVLPHVKGDPEEERRLAYVAVTRARDSLVLSYARRIATRAGMRDMEPSRFLLDTGLPLDLPPETSQVFVPPFDDGEEQLPAPEV